MQFSTHLNNWRWKAFPKEIVIEYFNFNSAKLFDFYRKVKRAPPIGSSPVIAASYEEQEGDGCQPAWSLLVLLITQQTDFHNA